MDVCPRLLAGLILTSLVAGCEVGELPSETTGTTPDAPGSTTGTNGDISFNSTIKPLLNVCLSCHSGPTAPTLSSFSALQSKYKMKPGSSNVLVTKGDHQGIKYLSAADKMKVAMWIDSL